MPRKKISEWKPSELNWNKKVKGMLKGKKITSINCAKKFGLKDPGFTYKKLRKIFKIHPMANSDGDKKRNYKDCRPFDRTKHALTTIILDNKYDNKYKRGIAYVSQQVPGVMWLVGGKTPWERNRTPERWAQTIAHESEHDALADLEAKGEVPLGASGKLDIITTVPSRTKGKKIAFKKEREEGAIKEAIKFQAGITKAEAKRRALKYFEDVKEGVAGQSGSVRNLEKMAKVREKNRAIMEKMAQEEIVKDLEEDDEDED